MPHTCLECSDALHDRVQRFILSAGACESFDELALDIARFQERFIPGYARLVHAKRAPLTSVEQLPPVPVEAFRVARIAAHAPDADAVRYVTSGTTSETRGLHVMRRTDTYETSALTWARQMLLPPGNGPVAVVALMPEGMIQTSSLAAMAQMFMDQLQPSRGSSAPPSVSPWLMSDPNRVVAALLAHLEQARALNVPLLVVATSYGLVHLLDELGDSRLDVWPHTVVMPTGGFKGRTAELSAVELRTRVASALGIAPRQVIGEYGMTELSSQLYEGARLEAEDADSANLYYAPPWLRVRTVDPETLAAAPSGEPGLACFIDLANVDSAICVVTQDLVQQQGRGFRLLGRQMGAPARGCSLTTQQWLGQSSVGQ
jgi:hypothetical protein